MAQPLVTARSQARAAFQGSFIYLSRLVSLMLRLFYQIQKMSLVWNRNTYHTAADLPPELIDRMLDFIEGGWWIGSGDLVEMNKKELAQVALTCRYWNKRCQPRIFQTITLRSKEDVYSLLAFLRDPHSRVSSLISNIILQARPDQKHAVPWIHLAFILLPPKVLRKDASVTLAIEDFSLLPKSPRFYDQGMPKSGPTFSSLKQLRLDRVQFDHFHDLIRLVCSLRVLESLQLQEVTWHASDLPQHTRRLSLQSSLCSLAARQCTNNALIFEQFMALPRWTPYTQAPARARIGSVHETTASFVAKLMECIDPGALLEQTDSRVLSISFLRPDSFGMTYFIRSGNDRSNILHLDFLYDGQQMPHLTELEWPPGIMRIARLRTMRIILAQYNSLDEITVQGGWATFDVLFRDLHSLQHLSIMLASSEVARRFHEEVLPTLVYLQARCADLSLEVPQPGGLERFWQMSKAMPLQVM